MRNVELVLHLLLLLDVRLTLRPLLLVVLVGAEARLVNADHQVIPCQRCTDLLRNELPLAIKPGVIVPGICGQVIPLHIVQALVQDLADGGFGGDLVQVIAG